MEFISQLFGSGDLTTKVVIFLLVQALVFLILSKSSSVFTSRSRIIRSPSFAPMRSASIQRMLAFISDFPGGGEALPSPPKSAGSTASAKRRY